MKKFLAATAVLSLAASTVFATAFAPSVMTLSASKQITYKFDGSSLSIPVSVGGAPGSAVFEVFTKGKAATIARTTNGYLGWHEVNKIDTCVFTSNFTSVVKGSNTIVWNGLNDDGKQVPAGEYTYYIFAYDNVTPRVQMTKAISISPWIFRTIITNDAKGAPLANPIWYTSDGNRSAADDAVAHTHSKWIVGNDPADTGLKETTGTMGWCDVGGLAFTSDSDFTKYFFYDTLKNAGQKITQKYEWVPNGSAVLQTDWADNGQFSYTGAWPSGWNFGPGCVNDNNGTLFLVDADISGTGTESQLIYLDIASGTESKRFDLSSWWVDVNEGSSEGGGQYCGGPTEICIRNGSMFLGSHSTCVNQMLNPYADDEDNVVLWSNTNGDYTGDHNFEESSTKKWVCNDYNVGPYKYSTSADANNFVVFSSFDMGAVSFGLYAPDGTGLGYQAFAGETARQKYGVEFIDYGSPYDGMYTTNNTGESGVDATIWFIAHDSITGTISDQVDVADAAPAAFAVAQNSPNPFNPTTTISFTLAKAGKTTVDVYNVAGQKISTLVNSSLSAGSHSVTWNAAKFSAGVYFYTVKSGDFSKTMKMTLLK